MLNDEVKKAREKDPALVCQMQAACRYCGQSMMVDVLVNWGVQEAETVATELCDCTQASLYTRKMRRREKAKIRIRQLFADDTIADSMHQDIVPFLSDLVDAVADEKIKKVTCSVGDGITAVIQMTSKDTIKTQRIIRADSSYEE